MMYQTDYVIAWDFSDKDAPAVCISKVYADKMHLMCDEIFISNAKCGVVSVQQLLADFASKDRVCMMADNGEVYTIETAGGN